MFLLATSLPLCFSDNLPVSCLRRSLTRQSVTQEQEQEVGDEEADLVIRANSMRDNVNASQVVCKSVQWPILFCYK